jgi:hypothetical protein
LAVEWEAGLEPAGSSGGDRQAWPDRSARRSRPGPTLLSLDALAAAIAPGFAAHTSTRPASLTLTVTVNQGRWTPPVTLQRADVTLLVLAGCLLRRSPHGADLLLERDIAQVGADARERWRGLSPRPAVVAVLSSATIADLARVPGLAQALLRASRDQHERDLELRAIVGIYDVRERIVQFFRHLARHVGRPEGAATRIPLRLEQKRIEELVAAGHTQATTAFRSLFRAGALTHDADGWLFDDARTAALNGS